MAFWAWVIGIGIVLFLILRSEPVRDLIEWLERRQAKKEAQYG